ncbi:hypothetical protein [uncultured Vibrio sp.]|uniref:hypothetical protein n=1 Tax=uncultured Vibrio sp. TaxID=114054 RepID=UPI002AAC0B46|nr:hypothetical protein [uncultured Vibrio sp.]
MKRSRVLLLALSSLFSTMTFAAGDTIRFGTDATFPPFESITPEGEIVGFEVDNDALVSINVQTESDQFPQVWVKL